MYIYVYILCICIYTGIYILGPQAGARAWDPCPGPGPGRGPGGTPAIGTRASGVGPGPVGPGPVFAMLFAFCYAAIPVMPNMNNTLTTIGHRFGHQSGLDGSSGRNSFTFPHGIALHVFLLLAEITNTKT